MLRISSLLLLGFAVLATACGGGGSTLQSGLGPDIASIQPASGGMAGGTPIVIQGSSLANPRAGAYEILIGGQPADEVVVVDDTRVECRTPPGAQGAADVTIVTVEGEGTAPGAFTYYPPPSVTSITPDEGTRDGGVGVTVTGTGFQANDPGETVCLIGLKALDDVVVVSDTELQGLTPTSWTEVPKDVIVTNRNGTGTLRNGFTYVGPVPIITSVTPDQGPRAGGTAVTVTGDFFTEAGGELFVRFGSAEASLVTRVDDQTITCLTPLSAAPGYVDVTVGNNNGEASLPSAFFYIPAPELSTISPNQGSQAGGTNVSITGSGFTAVGAGVTVVTIGGNAVSNLAIVNDNLLTCTTPASAVSGLVDVRIVNGNGQDILTNAFTYLFAPVWDSDYGSAISTSDDTNTYCAFSGGFQFTFFGTTYDGVYFGSNGWLGFGSSASGQTWYSSQPSWPCINFVSNDMAPHNGGSLHFKQLADRAVLTMNGVPEYFNTGSNTIQIILHQSGAFAIMYAQLQATGFYVTVGPGSGQSLQTVDWTTGPSGGSNTLLYEYNPTDLGGRSLLLEVNAGGGYDTTVFSL